MSKYDDLFAETSPTDSVFADKSVLDPLTSSDEIIAREEQERALATILNSIHEGYLPPTVSIHGPPETGKPCPHDGALRSSPTGTLSSAQST